MPHYDFLRGLQGKYDLSVYCGITIQGDRGQFLVPPDALRLFVELGIDMDLSLIFSGYSDLEAVNADAANAIDPLRSEGSDASFEVSGNPLDVSQIARTLGIGSSQTQRPGDAGFSGKLSPTNFWFLAAPVSRSSELDAHLRWFGTKLLPHVEFLKSLKTQCEMLIKCNFVTRSDTGGVVISAEGLKAMTELDINLDFNAFLIWRELTKASE